MTIQETIYHILSEYPNAIYDSQIFLLLMKNQWKYWDKEERNIARTLVKYCFSKIWAVLDNDDYSERRNFVAKFSQRNSFDIQSVYSVFNNFKVAYSKYQKDQYTDDDDDEYSDDDDDDDYSNNGYGGYAVNATQYSLFPIDCFALKSPLQIATMRCIIDTLNDLLSQGILTEATKDIYDEFMLIGCKRNGKTPYVGVQSISDGIIAVAKWDLNTGGLDLSTIRNCTTGPGLLRKVIIDIINGR